MAIRRLRILHLPPHGRFWAHLGHNLPSDECWIWPGRPRTDGYCTMNFTIGRKRVTQKVHRIAWEIHHGPIPAGIEVHHDCHVPACVNPAHLILATPLQNRLWRTWRVRAQVRASLGSAAPLTVRLTPEHSWWIAGEAPRRNLTIDALVHQALDEFMLKRENQREQGARKHARAAPSTAAD